jgi:hypothetical protein
MIFARQILIGIFAAFSLSAHAQHVEGGGYPFEMPRTRPSLGERDAKLNFEITGLSPEAQMHTNLAVEAMHGFWIYQAERHLREVMRLAPLNPMPFALAAFAETIFGSGDYERGLGYFAQAKALYAVSKAQLSEREKLWFMAISALYDSDIAQPELRQMTHLQILEKIVSSYPNDLEAKAFMALATWLYQILNDSIPPTERQILTARTDLLIEEILQAAPEHPAHHYKIHLWNNGNEEFHALDSARASGPAQSHIAHLWHMPAHIFTRTRDIYYAMRHVDVAHRVDNAQLAQNQLMPTNVHNYYHNFRDFGLNLGANFGQLSEALNRSKAMLEFGRLPHFGSRIGHAFLALKMIQHLEKYEAWQRFGELDRQGYFDALATANTNFDQEFRAHLLRMRLRCLLSDQTQIAENLSTARDLVSELEGLKNQAALAGAANLTELNALFEDARLWFEVSIRRNDDAVPGYYLEKLLQLNISPKTQLILLADDIGHRRSVEPIAVELLSAKSAQTITDQLNLLSFFASSPTPMSAEVQSKLIESAAANIQPPVELKDFVGLAIARAHPRLLADVLEQAERRDRYERSNPPGAFAYIDRLNMDDMGPKHPVRQFLLEYRGANQAAAQAFATPEANSYKLLIYSAGPACLACNAQLQKLIAAKDVLENLGIETAVITATGENVAGLLTVPDADHDIHRQFEVWDQFNDEPLHGVFLLDSNRRLLWHSVTEHAVDQVDFLVGEFGRLIKLAKATAG